MASTELENHLRCSNCSQMVRPLVALDIDGTLGNYHQHFSWFCSKYFNMAQPEYHWDGKGEFEDYLGVTKAKYREAKLAYRQGGMKRWMPVYPAAKSLIDFLGQHAEVWIATSRPWQRLDNIDPDTLEWLYRNGLKFDGIVYGDDKYEMLLSAIDSSRIVAVVDDLYEQIIKANELNLYAIQRWNFHNSHYAIRTTPGSSDLAEIGRMITRRIGVWRNRHEPKPIHRETSHSAGSM